MPVALLPACAARHHAAPAVRRVATHPHAAAQTRRWVARRTSRASRSSTRPRPRRQPRRSVRPGSPTRRGTQPIAAPLAAEQYALEALAEGIGDNAEAVTRFVPVPRPAHPDPRPPGGTRPASSRSCVRTSPAALRGDPGAVRSMRGVNLTRIESRPTGHTLGDYCFSVDAEGHVTDRRVGEALMGLHRVCADVRFLGSYERHGDGKAPRIRPSTTDSGVHRRLGLARQPARRLLTLGVRRPRACPDARGRRPRLTAPCRTPP